MEAVHHIRICSSNCVLLPVLDTLHTLLIDATVQYLRKEHIPFAITAFLIIYSFHILPPLLLTFYPCKIFNRSLNCCSEKRQHVLCTFWKPFKDSTKLGDGISDQCLESIIYIIMLLHFCNFPCWSQIINFAGHCMHLTFSCTAIQEHMNVLDAYH